jgi:hypothetical protein
LGSAETNFRVAEIVSTAAETGSTPAESDLCGAETIFTAAETDFHGAKVNFHAAKPDRRFATSLTLRAGLRCLDFWILATKTRTPRRAESGSPRGFA